MKYKKTTNIFTDDYLTMRQYIRDLIADFLICGIFYRGLCFRTLDGLTPIASKILLLILATLALIAEIKLVSPKGKNMLNACIMATLVFSIYNLAAYFRISPKFYICLRGLCPNGYFPLMRQPRSCTGFA